MRDIERIPEASILTNRPPYCYASCLAVTERSMPESSIGLRSWQSLFGILRLNCSRIYSSITFPWRGKAKCGFLLLVLRFLRK